MTENIESIILEHLRVIRSDTGAVKADVGELKLRMSSMEEKLAELCWVVKRGASGVFITP